jgi:hypothetical protein
MKVFLDGRFKKKVKKQILTYYNDIKTGNLEPFQAGRRPQLLSYFGENSCIIGIFYQTE